MELADFDFDLPEDLIALRPARPRSAARLLVAEADRTHDSRVANLPKWLRRGDMLVFNDTRVIPARLTGERRRESSHGSGTARIEATLIRRQDPGRWAAFARPAKRLAAGDTVRFGPLSARVEGRAGAEVVFAFDRAGAALDAAVAEAGEMPLPPYIAQRRAPDDADRTDYQTVVARTEGAVAAPTAALHFDEPLLAALDAAGILRTTLTLHVGPGTFLPVTETKVENHRMHAEWGEIRTDAAEAITQARRDGGRIIAVGTTALRLLETAAAEDGTIRPFTGETDIFIRPGYRFRGIDGLMTNFHLPRSTLFMLVSALMGTERMQALYAHAVDRGYRFYSYGDSSLLLP